MNLQEFINHRKNCPICDKELVLSYHSDKRQSFRYEEGRLIVIFSLDGLKRGQSDYKVGYSFSLKDNSWWAEFYSKDEMQFEKETPLFLLDRFRSLDQNLSSYRFYKHCDGCKRHTYFSNDFKLNTKTSQVPELSVNSEFYGLKSGDKCVKMINVYYSDKSLNQSLLYLIKSDDESSVHWGQGHRVNPSMILPIIPFVTHDKTMERISNLIVFS